MSCPLPEASNTRNGFSMAEMLAVMAIFVLMAVMIAPAMNTITRGSALTQGTQMIADRLHYARETALSMNRSMEVRFYQFANPRLPGESADHAGTWKFRGIQIFQIQESGTASALGKMQMLPPTVIMDSSAALSSIIGSAVTDTSTAVGPGMLYDGPSIPNVGTQYHCVTFRIFPDGSTNLSPSTGKWFVTLHNLVDGDNRTSPPANFTTVQIDALNGHIKSIHR